MRLPLFGDFTRRSLVIGYGRLTETSVINYQPTPRNITEEGRLPTTPMRKLYIFCCWLVCEQFAVRSARGMIEGGARSRSIHV